MRGNYRFLNIKFLFVLYRLSQLIRGDSPTQLPLIVFDHPSQDYTFPAENERAKIIFAIRAMQNSTISEDRDLHHFSWQKWKVILEVNAQTVGSWDVQSLVNAYGEVKLHIYFGFLPVGEHVATCRLVKDAYDEMDIEHTVSFYVGNISTNEEVTEGPFSGDWLNL